MERTPNNHESINEQPSIWGEVQMSVDYANDDRYSDQNLKDKYNHYTILLNNPDTNDRAKVEVRLIVKRLKFELDMRGVRYE